MRAKFAGAELPNSSPKVDLYRFSILHSVWHPMGDNPDYVDSLNLSSNSSTMTSGGSLPKRLITCRPPDNPGPPAHRYWSLTCQKRAVILPWLLSELRYTECMLDTSIIPPCLSHEASSMTQLSHRIDYHWLYLLIETPEYSIRTYHILFLSMKPISCWVFKGPSGFKRSLHTANTLPLTSSYVAGAITGAICNPGRALHISQRFRK